MLKYRILNCWIYPISQVRLSPAFFKQILNTFFYSFFIEIKVSREKPITLHTDVSTKKIARVIIDKCPGNFLN